MEEEGKAEEVHGEELSRSPHPTPPSQRCQHCPTFGLLEVSCLATPALN